VPSDLQALLAAVVADPADDTARLVYADCLEESGNAARAAFIRLQIEAEHHHPDSNTRATLEGRAEALLAENWAEWWGEVCFSVGLPMPQPKPRSRLERLANRAGLRAAPGDPYQRIKFRVAPVTEFSARGSPWYGFAGVHFRRGFPDAVDSNCEYAFLTRWQRVSPLDSLTLSNTNYWGPHLAGVREVRATEAYADLVRNILTSPHSQKLESLHLELPEVYHDLAEGLRAHPLETGTSDPILVTPHLALCGNPQTQRLKRLRIRLAWNEAAEEVANAAPLSGLMSLQVALVSLRDLDRVGAGHRLAILSRSPHLAGLKELSAYGGLSADGVAAAIQNPTWSGLRKLELGLQSFHDALVPFAGPSALDELNELRLLGVRLDHSTVAALARSALLKRVRHFALSGGPINRETLPPLIAAVDRERIETFTLLIPRDETLQEYAAGLLNRWFGDRAAVRVY